MLFFVPLRHQTPPVPVYSLVLSMPPVLLTERPDCGTRRHGKLQLSYQLVKGCACAKFVPSGLLSLVCLTRIVANFDFFSSWLELALLLQRQLLD